LAAAAAGAAYVVNPSLWCEECEWCRRGEQPLCVRFRILGEHTQGGLAEYVVVPARNLLAVPAGYPLERAAAAPLPFLTAWRGLVTRARLQPGETVLITGASGGVATAAVQLARHIGAKVYAVTTGEHVEQVRALGADVVYDRAVVDFSQDLGRDTGGRGVDVVFDSVGSATWRGVLRSVARLGRLVVYGATTGPQAQLDLRALFWKQVDIMGTTMATQAEFEAVMKLVFDGVLTPVVDVVWPLAAARAAHERLESGAQFGKIVLRP
jgi:NADPH:quinone reductase-like Zn-dependent oxidoreductase